MMITRLADSTQAAVHLSYQLIDGKPLYRYSQWYGFQLLGLGITGRWDGQDSSLGVSRIIARQRPTPTSLTTRASIRCETQVFVYHPKSWERKPEWKKRPTGSGCGTGRGRPDVVQREGSYEALPGTAEVARVALAHIDASTSVAPAPLASRIVIRRSGTHTPARTALPASAPPYRCAIERGGRAGRTHTPLAAPPRPRKASLVAASRTTGCSDGEGATARRSLPLRSVLVSAAASCKTSARLPTLLQGRRITGRERSPCRRGTTRAQKSPMYRLRSLDGTWVPKQETPSGPSTARALAPPLVRLFVRPFAPLRFSLDFCLSISRLPVPPFRLRPRPPQRSNTLSKPTRQKRRREAPALLAPSSHTPSCGASPRSFSCHLRHLLHLCLLSFPLPLHHISPPFTRRARARVRLSAAIAHQTRPASATNLSPVDPTHDERAASADTRKRRARAGIGDAERTQRSAGIRGRGQAKKSGRRRRRCAYFVCEIGGGDDGPNTDNAQETILRRVLPCDSLPPPRRCPELHQQAALQHKPMRRGQVMVDRSPSWVEIQDLGRTAADAAMSRLRWVGRGPSLVYKHSNGAGNLELRAGRREVSLLPVANYDRRSGKEQRAQNRVDDTTLVFWWGSRESTRDIYEGYMSSISGYKCTRQRSRVLVSSCQREIPVSRMHTAVVINAPRFWYAGAAGALTYKWWPLERNMVFAWKWNIARYIEVRHPNCKDAAKNVRAMASITIVRASTRGGCKRKETSRSLQEKGDGEWTLPPPAAHNIYMLRGLVDRWRASDLDPRGDLRYVRIACVGMSGWPFKLVSSDLENLDSSQSVTSGQSSSLRFFPPLGVGFKKFLLGIPISHPGILVSSSWFSYRTGKPEAECVLPDSFVNNNLVKILAGVNKVTDSKNQINPEHSPTRNEPTFADDHWYKVDHWKYLIVDSELRHCQQDMVHKQDILVVIPRHSAMAKLLNIGHNAMTCFDILLSGTIRGSKGSRGCVGGEATSYPGQQPSAEPYI
ncbi:hypothetical protein B0H10DRAFT_1940453 [Mycena sp. CBHHK59/15]|nr:hypothetical protein B0H10DRAFT_1940453 [Mycena sp. CBHHK59/15]